MTWLLGAAFVAAVWIAYFPLPILSYYKEWVYAALFAMAALLVGGAGGVQDRRGAGPRLELLGGGGLLAVLGVQVLLDTDVAASALLVSGYLLFYLVAVRFGVRLSAGFGRSEALVLATWVLLACLGNALATVAQIHVWDLEPWPLVAPRSGVRVGGNLAQANHAATLLWLGVLSSLVLWHARRISTGTAFAVIALMALFMAWTGSRMPLVVALLVATGASVVGMRRPPLRRLAVALVLSALVVPSVGLLWNFLGGPELLGLSAGGGDRLAADGGSSEVRRWLLYAAWEATREHPWTGLGVGRFAHHTYELALSSGRTAIHSSELHAHNLLTHTAAEMGLPAALLVGVALAATVRRAWQGANRSVAGLMLASVLAVLLTHAMLEYPLSYSYFLGPFGLVIGALWQLERQDARGELPVGGSADAKAGSGGPDRRSGAPDRVLQGGAVLVLVLLGTSHRLHAPVERALQEIVLQVGLGAVPDMMPPLDAALNEVPIWSPYRPYAEAARLISTVPTTTNAEAMVDRCERSLRFGPSSYLLGRCAVANRLAGRSSEAAALTQGLCRTYPDALGPFDQLLTLVSQQHPEVLELVEPCRAVLPLPAS